MTADIEQVLALLELHGIHTDSFSTMPGVTPEEKLANWFARQIEWQCAAVNDLSAKLSAAQGK